MGRKKSRRSNPKIAALKEIIAYTEKPWGHEELLFDKDNIGMKRLVIKPKQQTSFHYHTLKNEIFFVESGKAIVSFEKESGKKEIKKGGFVYIPKNTVHQTYNPGPQSLSIIEFSSPHSNADVVRVKDPYEKTRSKVEKTIPFSGRSEKKTSGPRKAVFLDRDGVINANRPDYVKSWAEFVFLPKVKAAIRQLNNAGYLVVVITNQSCVGKGIIKESDLAAMHRKMLDELNQAGAYVDTIYFCPHKIEDNCNCRKPKTKMINDAVKTHGIDLPKSWLVGDSIKYDMPLGKAAGIKTILLSHGKTFSQEELAQAQPDYVVNDLMEAAQLIKGNIFGAKK